MGLIREPLDVDFYIKSRPLTDEEKRQVSEFIRSQKHKTTTATSVKRFVPQKKKVLA
jgi:hypothetical protein